VNAASFRSLNDRAGAAALSLAGEAVTIGSWTGQAIVNGGPHYLVDTPGGAYAEDALTISVAKTDLDSFVPLAQMDVTARGKALRIPDQGIVEYNDRYVITAAGREVPAR
jgi:hypothetical protein